MLRCESPAVPVVDQDRRDLKRRRLGVAHECGETGVTDEPGCFTVGENLRAARELGGGMIIYLAGLQNVPNEFKEAATVDGANSIQSFFRITLPLMTPVLLFQTITGLIWTLQLLVPALLLTPQAVSSGGLSAGLAIPPDNRLYMVHLYEQTFIYQRFGYGLALAWILFIVIMILSLILVRTSRHWVYYEVDIDTKKTEA